MKKPTILLLIFYICTISIVPCCIEDSCSEETNTEQIANSEHQEDDDKNHSCTQFFNCGNCSGFIPIFSISFKASQSPNTITSFYLFSTSSDFIARIWQPPI